MRARIWPLVAAYSLVGALAAALVLARGAGGVLPASAPLGGEDGALAGPPPWALVRLPPGEDPLRAVVSWAMSAASWGLGGFVPRADAALASVFPGLQPGSAAPAHARPE